MSTDDDVNHPDEPGPAPTIYIQGNVSGQVAQAGTGGIVIQNQAVPPVVPTSPVTTQRAASVAWFDELPLDWTREETRRTHDLLVEAFPFTVSALTLAQNSGLRPQTLSQVAPVDQLMREILDQARRANRLLALLAEVLSDPAVEAYHQPLNALLPGAHARIREAALLRRPSLATLAMLPPAVELWAPGEAEATAIADVAEFERTINAAAGFNDIRVFRARLAEAEARTARVDIRGKASGTGFLVGDRYLLTNWHVVKNAAGDGCVARFDHSTSDATGAVLDGRPVAFADDWLVASSVHDEHTVELSPDGPVVGTWDFALVRLAEPIGAQGIGPDPQQIERGVRGHYQLDGGTYDFQPEEPVLIIGHPAGRPMQLSYASPAQLRTTKHGNRIRYRTNTEGGSSGSPVFNRDWRIVGLHHAAGPTKTPGELDQQTAGFNQGIPMPRLVAEIRRQLAGAAELAELALG